MKHLLSLLLPCYSGQNMEVITINGQERYLVHEVYTWLGFNFVGESFLFECFHDAVSQMSML